jgi:hypothetical protein
MRHKVKIIRSVVVNGHPNVKVGDIVKLEKLDARQGISEGWAALMPGETLSEAIADESPRPAGPPRDLQIRLKGHTISPGKICCGHVKPDSRKPGAGEIVFQCCPACLRALQSQTGRSYKCRLASPVLIREFPGVSVGDVIDLDVATVEDLLPRGAVKLLQDESFFEDKGLPRNRDWFVNA